MLPILPALLLLLFQGPAHFERSLMQGRWQAEIQHQDRSRIDSDADTIAHLLATGNDPQLAQALFAFFKWIDRPELVVQPAKLIVDRTVVVRLEPPPARLAQGFAHSARSRDGPLVG